MSPRKSSTSSGRSAKPERPRYLAVEVAGEPFAPSPRWLEQSLSTRLRGVLTVETPVRVIRLEAGRALVRVDHRAAPAARAAWNGPMTGPAGEALTVRTHRTHGTLRLGKDWLRAGRPKADV